MKILIGHTGFVGGNLHKQYNFDAAYNSGNIQYAFGTVPDLCVYSGIRAEKFKADSFPDEDLAHIKNAIENIKQIGPKKLVLISTVDVIPAVQSGDVYEDTPYDTASLTPYGQNRLFLENEVRALFPHALIVRLPALFGHGLKKNFIYDLINYVPAMLKKQKFEELLAKEALLADFYYADENGFYRIKTNIDEKEQPRLKSIFAGLGFSALNFTDSRSAFSFYNLNYLWQHIEILLENNIRLAHMATETVSAGEIYNAIHGSDFINEVQSTPFNYHFFKTRYGELLGGSDGYIFDKETVISQIVYFVKEQME